MGLERGRYLKSRQNPLLGSRCPLPPLPQKSLASTNLPGYRAAAPPLSLSFKPAFLHGDKDLVAAGTWKRGTSAYVCSWSCDKNVTSGLRSLVPLPSIRKCVRNQPTFPLTTPTTFCPFPHSMRPCHSFCYLQIPEASQIWFGQWHVFSPVWLLERGCIFSWHCQPLRSQRVWGDHFFKIPNHVLLYSTSSLSHQSSFCTWSSLYLHIKGTGWILWKWSQLLNRDFYFLIVFSFKKIHLPCWTWVILIGTKLFHLKLSVWGRGGNRFSTFLFRRPVQLVCNWMELAMDKIPVTSFHEDLVLSCILF